MRKAEDVIVSVLEKECNFIEKTTMKHVASCIVDALGLEHARYIDIAKLKSSAVTTYTPVKYDLDLRLEDILLVEKFNGANPALYFDPNYFRVLKCYFKLLGKDINNTMVISDSEYIMNTLASHADVPEAATVCAVDDPTEYIRKSINLVCDAVPFYRSFK